MKKLLFVSIILGTLLLNEDAASMNNFNRGFRSPFLTPSSSEATTPFLPSDFSFSATPLDRASKKKEPTFCEKIFNCIFPCLRENSIEPILPISGTELSASQNISRPTTPFIGQQQIDAPRKTNKKPQTNRNTTRAKMQTPLGSRELRRLGQTNIEGTLPGTTFTRSTKSTTKNVRKTILGNIKTPEKEQRKKHAITNTSAQRAEEQKESLPRTANWMRELDLEKQPDTTQGREIRNTPLRSDIYWQTIYDEENDSTNSYIG